MPPIGAPFSRDALLDAAEAVILRAGIGALTLDAVAAEAKVSKGGLLHHFPGKERLIEAMVARIVETWRSDVREAIDRTPEGPGRLPRALLDLCLDDPNAWSETCRRSCQVLVAALANNPALVEPLRDCHREMSQRSASDGLPPGVADAVVLAIDGLWFKWIFGIADVSPKTLAPIRAALEHLINTAPAPKAGTSRSIKRPRPVAAPKRPIPAAKRAPAARPKPTRTPPAAKAKR